MDRWQLWRRLWFRLNRKSHSQRQYNLATRTRSAPEARDSTPPARYVLGARHFSFISIVTAGMTQRPKVLLDVDCSNLLIGGSNQYENFSSTCWLENHLHRFGAPSNWPPEQSTSNTEQEASSSSVDLDESFPDFFVNSAEDSEDDMQYTMNTSDSSPPPSSSQNNTINLHRYPYIDNDVQIIEPPPYADEPPPSYEEAIAGSSFSDFPNENTDFLW